MHQDYLTRLHLEVFVKEKTLQLDKRFNAQVVAFYPTMKFKLPDSNTLEKSDDGNGIIEKNTK